MVTFPEAVAIAVDFGVPVEVVWRYAWSAKQDWVIPDPLKTARGVYAYLEPSKALLFVQCVRATLSAFNRGNTSMVEKAVFTYAEYDKLLQSTFAEMQRLGTLKGGEYTRGEDDRLANFRRIGQELGLPMEAVWHVYFHKHLDAVVCYMKDRLTGTPRPRTESITGRIDDMLVYLVILKCMVTEHEKDGNKP